MNDYQIGDFGRFKFTVRYKGKHNWFDLYAEVTGLDNKFVWLTDNDGYQYLPHNKDVEYFKKAIKGKAQPS